MIPQELLVAPVFAAKHKPKKDMYRDDWADGPLADE
jgi:hypothetical protein